MDEPRYIIIHGHFYQPPRQSPWTGIISPEPSAAPFANWNERILSECYIANAHAHIMEGRVVYIRNNYETLNFDFGPTLAAWLETHGRSAYHAIRSGDQAKIIKGKPGNAIAQSYNHSILPLLDARGRELQIAWGLQDFTYRFGRAAEGIWLPECALDEDTLVSVAQAGLKFVILGADQGRFSSSGREAGPFQWRHEALSLSIFRFDRPLAGEIAFGSLLDNGESFAGALAEAALQLAPGAALMIATDGETFGHHKRSGAAELARAIDVLKSRDDVVVTNCAEYMSEHPATGSFTIDSASSWSCAHGVGRWHENCGCRIDPHTNQEWRRPLHDAMEFVRRHTEDLYDRFAQSLLPEPYQALKASGAIFSDPSPIAQEQFFTRHHAKDEDARERVLRLFEMVRAGHAALTSCAWFFDDFGGLEGRVALRWAARAVELTAELTPSIEPEVLDRLREIRSNRREIGDAATLYLSLKTREARGRV